MDNNIESKSYWVVEYRLPIRIDSAKDAKEAAEQAARQFEKEYGIRLSNWFARVFEYSPEAVGPKSEWFANPGGVKFLELTKNHEENNDNREGI